MSFRTAPRCLFKHRFSFWLLPFCRSIFLLRNPPWRHDCISSHMSFLWARNRHNLWAVRRCQFCRGKTGEQLAAEAFRGSSRHPAASPPLLLWDELLNSRRGWLFDSLKIYQSSLPSCPWPLKLQAVGDLRGGKKLTNDFSGLCQLTALAGCQQRECNIICSKLPAHTKWHKAV